MDLSPFGTKCLLVLFKSLDRHFLEVISDCLPFLEHDILAIILSG